MTTYANVPTHKYDDDNKQLKWQKTYLKNNNKVETNHTNTQMKELPVWVPEQQKLQGIILEHPTQN